jgi:hypothetical protein
MKKTKFDMLFEKVVTVNEGRKKKVYPQYTLDVNKLMEDMKTLKSPFKNMYISALQHVVDTGNLPETKPEWEKTIKSGFYGQSLGEDERSMLFKRLWHILNTPDHSYFVEYDPTIENVETTEKSITSVEEHIYNYIIESDDEAATRDEIISLISKYGYEGDEINKIIDKMIAEGELGEQNGRIVAVKDPTLDEIDVDEDLTSFSNQDELDNDMEGLRTDIETGDIDNVDTDSAISHDLDPDIAKELGIDVDDPWGQKEMLDDNISDIEK